MSKLGGGGCRPMPSMLEGIRGPSQKSFRNASLVQVSWRGLKHMASWVAYGSLTHPE